MALADIIKRIEDEARAEAERARSDAAAYAEKIASDSLRTAEEQRAELLKRAEKEADAEAARMVATARLEARDTGLAAKRTAIMRALEGVRESLEALPDDRYVLFVAALISESARGGETVRVAAADVGRKDAIASEVARLQPALSLQWSDEIAPGLERGVLLEGDRVRAEVSPAALVEERRDELELRLASLLFEPQEG